MDKEVYMVFVSACDLHLMSYGRYKAADKKLKSKVFDFIHVAIDRFKEVSKDDNPHVHIYYKILTVEEADSLEVDVFLHSIQYESTASGDTGPMEDPR